MAILVFKTFSAGEVLTASDLNSSFTQIVNNGADLVTPFTKDFAAGGFGITGLRAAAANGEAVRYEQLSAFAALICNFRLTLTTAVPVTTSDVTAATTVYVAPYEGGRIGLYDGTQWNIRTSAEMSIAVPATTSTMYDLFCYDSSGTPTLETLVWTNDTTRATALTTQNGVLVKSGAVTRRYLGSFRTTGVSGQTEDSLAKRYVWNYYNRIRRDMRVFIAAASYTYTTAVFRQAGASAVNQLDMVIGVSENVVRAEIIAGFHNTSVGVVVKIGVGVDSTTVESVLAACGTAYSLVISREQGFNTVWTGFPGVGRHYLAWLEYSEATGTTTWNPNTRFAICGELWG